MNRRCPYAQSIAMKARRGTALVVVLVVVTLLSFAAYTFTDLMFAEYQAADASGRSVQTRLLCESGAEKLQSLLKLDTLALLERGGIYDNPAELQAIAVVEGSAAGDRARFSILAPAYAEGAEPSLRYGLEDESAKLNLNVLLSLQTEEEAQRARLLAVPGMSEEIADSILDWLDDDDEPREFGAEAGYYSGLAPPYAPKNGPLTTLEELLLVRGVTPQHLFGLDADRNGLADPNEQVVLLPAEVDNSDRSFDRGWSGYFTLHGAEGNRKADGTPRININAEELETLFADLQAVGQPELASFVVNYRQSGAYTGSAGAGTNQATSSTPDFTKSARYKFQTPLDLVGATTSATIQGTTIAIQSPVKNDPLILAQMLPLLMDQLSTTDAKVVPGRINVNQAPQALLLGIPGLREDQVAQIISMRYPEPTEQMPGSEYPTWLLAQGIVTLDEMKALLPYVTAAGHVYRAQIVGYYDDAGPTARVETLIDATSSTPRRLLWRELTHLGPGFPKTTLGTVGP